MSLFNPFKKLETRSTYLGSSSLPVSFVNHGGTIVPQNFVSAQKALQNVDVFAMVNLISSDIASCSFQNAGAYDQLLKQPSNLINGYSFWQSAMVQLLLTGNAYLLMYSDSGVTTRLEQIPTGNVIVNLDDDSKDILYDVNFTDGRKSIEATSKEMIHIRLLPTGEISSDYQFMGISPLNSLATSIQMTDSANRLTLSTLANGINPSTIITVPEAKVDSESKDAIRNSFEEQNSGSNAGRVIVMDKSASLSTIQINADVAKFLNSVDWGADRVAEAFGIPSSYLNRDKADAQSNSAQIVAFYVSSLNRYIQPLVSELSYKLQLPDLKLNVSDSTDITGSQTVDMITKLTSSNSPIISPRQAQNILVRKGIINEDDLETNDSTTQTEQP